MASTNNEIPVRRRRGGIPWWAWLIGLALLALLAFWLLNNMGGTNNNTGGNTGGSGGTAAQTQDAGSSAGASSSAAASASGGAAGDGPITELAEINEAQDPASLSGREVALEEAQVLSVADETSFFVGSDEQDHVFVRLDEAASAGQPVQVEEGQTVRIAGQVEERPADLSAWGLDEADAADLEEHDVYVAASEVEVAQ